MSLSADPVTVDSTTTRTTSAPATAPTGSSAPVRPRRTLIVVLTGATGFVGRHVARALVERGHEVRALVRRPGRRSELPRDASPFEGDVLDRASMDALVDKADACIHLVGIIMERPERGITYRRLHVDATANVVAACEAAGVLRYGHMSALGSRPDARSQYHQTKFEAEEIVRRSRLAWTIIRPSVIHGPDGELTAMMAGWARGRKAPFVFMPYFGAGMLGRGRLSRVQPVHVEDVAAAFVRALEEDRAVREVYPIGGPDVMTWPEMLAAFRDAIPGGPRWRRPIPVPAWYAAGVARMMGFLGLGSLVPFNVDQVIMSQEDATCDLVRVREHLGVEPAPFREALARYAASL